MSERRWLPALAMAAALVAAPLGAQEQPAPEQKNAPAREIGTTSAEARAEFRSAIEDVYNVYFERATQHFDKALQIDPRYGLARAIRANFASGLSPEEQKAQWEQAVADAAAGPNQEVLNVLAWRAQDPNEQRILLQALVTLSPKTATYAYRLANAQPDPAARIAALQKVATDFPDFAATHNTLAYLIWDTGDHDGAMREVQQYLKINPEHPNPHDSYAELLQRGGHYTEALEHYGHAIARDANFAEAYAGMAEVYQLTGKPAEARAKWQEAIAHEAPADQAQHFTTIAGSYLLQGNRKMALSAIGDAVKVMPAAQQPTGHALMTIVEATAGSAGAARAHRDELMKSPPANPLWAGLAAIFTGDTDAAKAAAGRAATSNPGAAHILNSLVASSAGDVTTAQAELTAAGPNGSAVPLAKAFLAQALARTGRKADARALRDQVQASDITFLNDVARLRVQKL